MRNIITKSFFIAVLYIALFNTTFAQNGPAGVGTTDVNSTLVLWLNADKISATGGATVSAWNDESGYSNDFSSGNGATFNKSIINGYSTLSFDGNDDYFERAFSSSLNSISFTFFSAAKYSTDNYNKAIYSNRYEDGNNTYGVTVYVNNNVWETYTGRGSPGWHYNSTGVNTVNNWAGFSTTHSSSAHSMQVNQGSAHGGSVANMTAHGNPMRVGGGRNENVTPQYYFKGEIGEIIMYNVVLNSAQTIIVDNYLAAKYSYALVGNDVYKGDDSGYDHQVAGIGRLDASNIHSSAQGAGKVRFSNAQGLGDNEFFMWGHDNGAIASTSTDIPANIQSRLVRKWMVSELNTGGTAVDVGAIDISFNLNGMNDVTASDLRLLIDTDKDGDFADEIPISGATETGSKIYSFSGVTAFTDGVIFTLATSDDTQSPLPIELIKFEVEAKANTAQLNWQTASEINNDYFTIERSTDKVNWSIISKINGSGNSNDLVAYFYQDNIMQYGLYYYRLKQTDFDGKYSYSQIRSIEITVNNSQDVTLYPNPFEQHIFIEGNMDELSEIKVYNALGQELKSIRSKNIGDNKILIDFSSINSGVYFIRTKSSFKKVFKN